MHNMSEQRKHRVYLAGPEVFLPDALAVGEAKVVICAEYGLRGLFPADQGLELAGLSKPEQARAIYEANTRLMNSADAIIANLTPFRGPSADVGTCFELGYMVAQDKPSFAYSNRVGTYASRVLEAAGRDGGSMTSLVDARGMKIEDFELPDNLMLAVPLALVGPGLICRSVAPGEEFRDLRAFRECVQAAADFFGRPSSPAVHATGRHR